MDDTTLFDKPGIELDAEMAQRILDLGDKYSEQTAELARFILDHRSAFRRVLVERDLIQQCDPSMLGFELAAVDGASAAVPHGGGVLVSATAYKVSINDERQRGASQVILARNFPDVDAFATMLRTHLELSLLSARNLDADRLVILDHSFWGVMQAVGRALAAYKSERARVLASGRRVELDAMCEAWSRLFQDCLDTSGSFLAMARNKQVISLSKTGISQYFVHLLSERTTNTGEAILSSALNDRALLQHVLAPGEYTTPQSVYRVVQVSGEIKSWKRSRFATHFEPADGPDPFIARDAVFDEYGLPRDSGPELDGRRLFLTYYRPHEWSRTYRIEFHEAMLSNRDTRGVFDLTGHGERFQRVLASVRRSVNPETKEPLCQVLADLRASSAVASTVSVLPERAFYQLRDRYRTAPDLLDIIDTLIAEERT